LIDMLVTKDTVLTFFVAFCLNTLKMLRLLSLKSHTFVKYEDNQMKLDKYSVHVYVNSRYKRKIHIRPK